MRYGILTPQLTTKEFIMIYARLIENKEPVGFYCTENEHNLFWCIDKVVDPYSCEYTLVPLSDSSVLFHFSQPLKKEEGYEDGLSWWELENLQVGENLESFINDDEMLEECDWFNFYGKEF
jgi:hypothetical protein